MKGPDGTTTLVTHILNRTAGQLGVATDIASGHQTARVAVGSLDFVDADNDTELMHAEQLPRTTVVLAGPPSVEHVGESKAAESVRA